MAQTNQYGLRQWSREEGLSSGDLNQAMAGVDSALARVAREAAGLVTELNSTVTGKLTQINNNAAQLAASLEDLGESKAEVVTGTYDGDGASSRDITLGFQPRAVLLETTAGARGTGSTVYGGIALPGISLRNPLAGVALSIIEDGFQVYVQENRVFTNNRGNFYVYLAIR